MTEQANQYQQIIAKCWADEAFKQRLLADPAGTLKQEGIEIPAGVSIKVVENTDASVYWVIPAKPSALADEVLMVASGAGPEWNWCSPPGGGELAKGGHAIR